MSGLKHHVLDKLERRAQIRPGEDCESASTRLPARMLLSLIKEAREHRSLRGRLEKTVEDLCDCGSSFCKASEARLLLTPLLRPEAEPPTEVEQLHVFVPWECPSCGRKAKARRDYVVECVCGARSASTPGAVI